MINCFIFPLCFHQSVWLSTMSFFYPRCALYVVDSWHKIGVFVVAGILDLHSKGLQLSIIASILLDKLAYYGVVGDAHVSLKSYVFV